MGTSSKIRTAVALFFGASLIICIKADGNSKGTSQVIEKTIFPAIKGFSARLREILTPDIFTQTDPLKYLREKTWKLKYNIMFDMNEDLCYGFITCMNRRFPPAYVPYVKLLQSLLQCRVRLDSSKIFINSVKRSWESKSWPPPPDTSSLDPELATLFSSDIFTDPEPPSVLIDKLIALPETRLSSIGKEIQYSQDPVIKYYFWYSRDLNLYLKEESNVRYLKNLRRDVAEIRQLKLSAPAIEHSERK